MKTPRYLLLMCLALAAVMALGLYSLREASLDREVSTGPEQAAWEDERTDGSYFTIVDGSGAVIDQTARVVNTGDELILADNRHFRVTRVAGDTGYAELLGTEHIDWRENASVASQDDALPVWGGKQNLVAVYHTHSDESYVPTDGTESIPGDGGIYKVGEVFVEQLRKLGVKVDYNKQPHEPHDNDAYRRSRRTAFRLLQKAPAAIIDIHRDGIPNPESYTSNVEGQNTTKVRFVVGRQNQNMGANLDFAKRLKGYMDERFPGSVQGIYLASGNYNQDLSPRSMLVEVGTYTNDRTQAQRGAAVLAEALPVVLGIGTAPATSSTGRGADWSGVLVVILVLVAAGLAFLWVSTGSWAGVGRRLRSFFEREWGAFPRPRRRREETRLRLVTGKAKKPNGEKEVERDDRRE